MKVTLEKGTDPYWSARNSWDDTGAKIEKVVIETSYPLVLTQSKILPPVAADTVRKVYEVLGTADLEVYGDDVTIHGPISAPGRNVTIIARVIHTLHSEKGLPGILVDGEAGAAPSPALLKGVNSDKVNGKVSRGRDGSKGEGVPFWGGVGKTPVPGGDGEGRNDASHQKKPGYTQWCDPVMDGECGTQGNEGKKGGNITLYAWRLDLWFPKELADQVNVITVQTEFPSPFVLSACGGQGGKGRDGQPGADGGDAGNGANLETGFQTISPSQNGRAGNGGNGGFGGKGGKGGDGGTIEVRVIERDAAVDPNSPGRTYPCMVFRPDLGHQVVDLRCSHVVLRAEGGQGGDGGEAGMPGIGGNAGTGGKAEGTDYIGFARPYRDWCRDGFPATPRGTGGRYGDGVSAPVATKPAPVRGGNGDSKTATVLNPATQAQVGELARTSQLRMVLESVRAAFLAAGFKPGDSITQDLNYLKQTLGVIRNSSKVGQNPMRIEALRREKEIAAQLGNMVALLETYASTGADIFGRSMDYVPLLSVATHEKTLKDSLGVLKENEEVNNTCREALEKSTDLATECETQARNLGAITDYLIGVLAKVNAERCKAQKDIEGISTNLPDARGRLKTALEAAQAQIDSSFGVSTATVINCLTQVAFLGVPFVPGLAPVAAAAGAVASTATAPNPASGNVPKTENPTNVPKEGGTSGTVQFSGLHTVNSALLGSIQLAQALNEGLTSVLSDSGEPVKKDYVIQKLEAVDPGKLDDFLKALPNGQYVVTDGRQLTVMREDLERLCRQFHKSLQKHEGPKDPDRDLGKELVDAMNHYADVLDSRTRVAVKYNSLLAEQMELVSQIRTVKARKEQALSLKTEALLDAVPEMTAMVSDLYDQLRLVCLNQLSMACRALAFWNAEPYENVAALIPGKPKIINYQTLNNAWLGVQHQIVGHLETAFSTPERFPALKDPAFTLEHSPFGVWIVLTREQFPDQFESLNIGIPAEFELHPKTLFKRTDAATTPMLPFHGKADVRLTQVRVFLPGLPCADPPLTVKITHGGREYVQNPNTEILAFQHKPRGFTFAYTPPPDSTPLLNEEYGWVTSKALTAGGSEDGSLGLAVEKTALSDCGYTPLGPFTKWTIDVPGEDNPGLDRSKIERIVLDFHGYHHEFEPHD
jgi:hypothetical protein